MDDDEWVRRLRRVVTEGVPADGPSPCVEPARPSSPAMPRGSVTPAEVVGAMRDVEQWLIAVDQRLRQLNERQDRIVDEVADAVVARLDARWARVDQDRAAT